MKRNRIKTYLTQIQKGHAPKVRERDIRYAFKMSDRLEKFNMDLADIDAHTLRLIEMIESEMNKIQMDKKQELQRQVK